LSRNVFAFVSFSFLKDLRMTTAARKSDNGQNAECERTVTKCSNLGNACGGYLPSLWRCNARSVRFVCNFIR